MEIPITPCSLLTYQLSEDYVTRRAPLREEHIRLVVRYRDRGLIVGGAVGDPPTRALLVFAAEPAVAEAFLAEDPYVREGLVRSWEVEPWSAVFAESLRLTDTSS
jgi:uncharacterized protein YciI